MMKLATSTTAMTTATTSAGKSFVVNSQFPLRIPHGDGSGCWYHFVAARISEAENCVELFEGDAFKNFKPDLDQLRALPSNAACYLAGTKEFDAHDGRRWAAGEAPRGFSFSIPTEQKMQDAAVAFVNQEVPTLRDFIKLSVNHEARIVSVEYFRADENCLDDEGEDTGEGDSVEEHATVTFDEAGRATLLILERE